MILNNETTMQNSTFKFHVYVSSKILLVTAHPERSFEGFLLCPISKLVTATFIRHIQLTWKQKSDLISCQYNSLTALLGFLYDHEGAPDFYMKIQLYDWLYHGLGLL